MSAKKCAEERTFGASTAPTRFPNEMSSARAQADPPPPWERGIGMAKAVVRGTQEARTPRRALLDVIFLTSRPAHVQDETSVANVAPRTHARTHKQKTPPPFRRTHRKRPVSKRGISGGAARIRLRMRKKLQGSISMGKDDNGTVLLLYH